MPVVNRIADYLPEMTAWRRHLHAHPELGFDCHETAGFIAAKLREFGVDEVHEGIAESGVVAIISGSGDGPTIALRADMDALPIQESSDVAYRSTVPGVMHACGHDAHVAMLTGAARLIADAHASAPLNGTVRLLFQPSEEASDDEGMSGARRMIDDGAMTDVAAIFGLHIGAHLPFGHAHISTGPIMAGSDLFVATVHGKSSHAGRPHEGTDAIALAAHAILACQLGTARRLSPHDEGTLSIGTIQGGFAENVLAECVIMRGLTTSKSRVNHSKIKTRMA
jgi:hippurate hydrolase